MRGTLVKLELSAWGSQGAGGWARCSRIEAIAASVRARSRSAMAAARPRARASGAATQPPLATRASRPAGCPGARDPSTSSCDGEHRQQCAGVPEGSARDERDAGGAPGSGQGPDNHRRRDDGDGEAHQDRQRLGQVAVALAMERLAGGGPEGQQVPELMDRERAEDEEGRAARDGKSSDAPQRSSCCWPESSIDGASTVSSLNTKTNTATMASPITSPSTIPSDAVAPAVHRPRSLGAGLGPGLRSARRRRAAASWPGRPTRPRPRCDRRRPSSDEISSSSSRASAACSTSRVSWILK